MIQSVALSDEPVVLREHGPKVSVEFYLRPREFGPPPDLNMNWRDDAFVADVLSFMKAHPTENVLLISGDTGPLLTAKRHGVPIRSLSALGWELKAEADEKDKQIAALKREVSELQRTGPSIHAEFDRTEGADKIQIVARRFLPLSDQIVEDLIGELRKKNPKVVEFRPPSSDPMMSAARPGLNLSMLRGPTKEDVDTYHLHYEQWIARARKMLRRLPEILTALDWTTRVTLTVANTGVEPARNSVVTLSTSPSLQLRIVGEERAGEKRLRGTPQLDPLPLPPKAPAWRNPFELAFGPQRDPLCRAPDVRPLVVPSPKTTNGFNWREGAEFTPATRVSFACDEFRHQGLPETWQVELAFTGAPRNRSGAVNVEIHASNLRKPVTVTQAVRCLIESGDCEEAARRMLRLSPASAR